MSPTNRNSAVNRRVAGRFDFHDRFMVVLISIGLAATCWLISAPGGTELGQKPWRPHSVLHVITDLMNLLFEYPTLRMVSVKLLAQCLTAAVLVVAAVAAWNARALARERSLSPLAETDEPKERSVENRLTTAAQLLLLGATCWAMLSSLWAVWPEAAFGAGLRQFMLAVGAVSIGRTLSRRGVLKASVGMVLVLALTALIGIWYYWERNPGQRLKFPIGNPIFLAACLLPAMLLSAAGLWLGVRRIFSDSPAGSGAGKRHGWLLVAGSAVSFILVGYAFHLADSRGPLVGLGAGVVVGMLVVAARARAKTIRWALIGLVGVIAIVGASMLAGQLRVESGGRGASARSRFYGWTYATRIWLSHPVIGSGQASFPLLAQPYASEDRALDPAALHTNIYGHAHSEWLQTAAELGIVGFLLVAGALGLTLAAVFRTALKSDDPRITAIALALGVTLAALIVEEAFDVALRLPGLPIVFHIVVGLCWAIARVPARPARTVPQPLRWAGLAAGVGLAAVMSWFAWADWQGAIVYGRVERLIEDNPVRRRAGEEPRYADALELQVSGALEHRLSVDDLVIEQLRAVYIASLGARHSVEKMQTMLSRLEPGASAQHLAPLAAQDTQFFLAFEDYAVSAGETLNRRMARLPQLGTYVGDTLALWPAVNQIRVRLGMQAIGDGPAKYEALVRWRQRAYEADVCDARPAMALLPLTSDWPMSRRLNLLRTPLRSGPQEAFQSHRPPTADEPGRAQLYALSLIRPLKPGIYILRDDPELTPTIEQWVAVARSADAMQRDPFAIETLRLAAAIHESEMRFDRAVDLAAEAAELAARHAATLPYGEAYALIDRAWYLLLGHADESERAVAGCRAAIEAWPMHGDREVRLIPVRYCLALYEFAAGHEQAAREVVRALEPGSAPDAIDERIGAFAAELYEIFIVFPPDRYPPQMVAWRQRADQLAAPARLRAMHLRALRTLLALGLERGARYHLEALSYTFADAREFRAVLDRLLAEFPENPLLLEAERLMDEPARPATGPATTPSTIPSTIPSTNPSTRPAERSTTSP